MHAPRILASLALILGALTMGACGTSAPRQVTATSAPSGNGAILRPITMTALPAASVYWRSGDFHVSEDLDVKPGNAAATYDFSWDLSKIAGAEAVRWQIATQPFPASGDTQVNFNPPGLLTQGEDSGKFGSFHGTYKALLKNSRPASLYVRVLPLSRIGANTLTGRISNTIRIYYGDRKPEGHAVPLSPLPVTVTPNLYDIRLVGFTPPDFYDPNRWGCVTVTGFKDKTPSLMKLQWKIGKMYCPPPYRGMGRNIDSFGDFVTWAADGIESAFDWVTGTYNGLKSTIVNTVLSVTHACEIVGVAGKGAEGACNVVVNAAADAGMAALGIPPSLPDFNKLVDQGLDGAVAFAADAIASQTGVPCSSECRKLMKKGLTTAADTLKSSPYSPSCGVSKEEAHRHGSEPWCPPFFVITKPAPGAIDVPPMAQVQVVRRRSLAPAGQGACRLEGDIEFRNVFPGGHVTGPTPSSSRNVKRQAVQGELYAHSNQRLQPMGFGQKLTIPLVFEQPVKYQFSWTKDMWSRSQIPSPDAQHPRGPDWFQLYSGAEAHISVWSDCSKSDKGKLVQRMPKV